VGSARTAEQRQSRERGAVALSQRLRFGQFPEPQDGLRFLTSRRHEAHAKKSDGDITAAIRESEQWQEVMVPVLEQWAERRRRTKDGSRLKPGPAPMYSPEEFEVMELYRRVMGATSYRATVERLSGFGTHRDRRLLGFDQERQAIRRGEPITFPGVPSETAMSKYRSDIGDDEREELWSRFLTRLRRDYAALSDDDASRIFHLDGTHVRVQGQAPIVDPNTGEVVNDGINPRTGRPAITVPDGGYIPPFRKGTKGGHGFTLVPLLDNRGVPVAHAVERIHEAEKDIAVNVISSWAAELRPHYPTNVVRVLSADSGLNSPRVRIACRNAGIIENLHPVSHGDAPESRRRADDYDRMRWGIAGTDAFKLNGHRELVPMCGCGTPTIARQAWIGKLGKAYTRLKGTCSTCGETVTLTSGRKRRAQNPDSVVRKSYRDPELSADLAAGNPLTYNDPMSLQYGAARFSRGEGWNGALARRYKLNNKRRRFRSRRQVELETNIVFSIMVSLAIAGREHEAGAVQQQLAA